MTLRIPGLLAARPILDAMAQPVIVTDLDSTIIYFNPAATELYGYTSAEAVGQASGDLLGTPTQPGAFEAAAAQLGRGLPWQGELKGVTRAGRPFTVLVTLTPVQHEGSPVAVIGMPVDITASTADHERLEAALALVQEQAIELRHQALHDFLTGLPNRALIVDRAEQMLVRARREHTPIAALFVDLDNFKDINDSLGHGAGDQLLQAVAARLSAALRASDTVGRLGGDEFVILAEGSSLAAGSALVAQRLLDVLAEPFVLDADRATPRTVTASIGIADGDRPRADDLLRDADIALYRAKAAGRNRYVQFAAEMHAAERDRLSVEADLAVALKDGQFFLDYLPTFGLDGLTTIGVEALLRWQHPRRGVVPPLGFIPNLEASGLILPVGRWILAEVCRQGAEWRDAGLPLAISMNVSARQLESDDFVPDVLHALTTSGLQASSLVVEITESTLMRDTAMTIVRLKALKHAGVRIAIDDFGTGYCSLAYLRQFPVDILKIDRSFIGGMNDSAEGDVLLRTLVQFGKLLGAQTVAEGIETDGQLHRLTVQGCDTGQGFLLAKPMRPDEVAEFVRSAAAEAALGARLSALPR